MGGEAAGGGGVRGRLAGLFENRTSQARLPNDRRQSSGSNGLVRRNWNSARVGISALLHDDVTTALANPAEAVLFENLADLRARKDA